MKFHGQQVIMFSLHKSKISVTHLLENTFWCVRDIFEQNATWEYEFWLLLQKIEEEDGSWAEVLEGKSKKSNESHPLTFLQLLK